MHYDPLHREQEFGDPWRNLDQGFKATVSMKKIVDRPAFHLSSDLLGDSVFPFHVGLFETGDFQGLHQFWSVSRSLFNDYFEMPSSLSLERRRTHRK